MIAWIVACLLALLSPVLAGGRGGHVIAFDSNNFPGATITTIACNNTSADVTALSAFVTAGIAANPTKQALHLTGRCDFSTATSSLSWSGVLGTAGIQNLVVWGYGASVNQLYIGGENYPQSTAGSARINTVSSGSTTLQLVTNADGTKFAVGDWIAVTGLAIQDSGNYPQNFQFFEYHPITALSGCSGSTACTVTVNEGITNDYKSTWPAYGDGSPASKVITASADNGSGLVRLTLNSTSGFVTGQHQTVQNITGTGLNGKWTITVVNSTQIDLQGSVFSSTSYTSGGNIFALDNGGPATIYLMPPSWSTNQSVYGLTFIAVSCGQEISVVGRAMAVYDMAFGAIVGNGCGSGAGPAPSANVSVSFFGVSLSNVQPGAGMEIDKTISSMAITQSTGPLFVQSASPNVLNIISHKGVLSGTAKNTNINGSTFTGNNFTGSSQSLAISPNCNGHGDTLTIDGSSISGGITINCALLKTVPTTYSSGVFTVPNNSVSISNAISWGVPGKKYFLGRAFGSTVCNAGVTFTITDITQDATNTYYTTDIVGALPTPSCNPGDGSAVYDRYVAYPAATITQRNSTGTNMTVFAPP